MVNEHAEKDPTGLAFLMPDQALTWENLDFKIRQIRNQLVEFSGKRVLLYLDGRKADDIALLIASSAFNMESILISNYHTEKRANELLQEFDGDFLIAMGEGRVQVLAKGSPHVDRLPISKPFVCILTSGTTGTPKCSVNLWERLMSAVKVKAAYVGKRWFIGFSLVSFAGLQVFLQCLFNRGTLVISKDISPQDAYQVLQKYGVQYLNCTPTYARQLAAGLPEGFRSEVGCITLGGEIVEQQLIDLLKLKLPNAKIIHIYASTELGATIEVKDEKEGFPLELLDGTAMKVEEGELLISPSTRSMLGYLNKDHEKTRGGFRITTLEKIWVPTGDLVEICGDRVKFLGRQDNMINVGGFKISPSSVEKVIRTIPGVSEVAVYGIKNPIAGNLVKASICVSKGANQNQIKVAILEACKKELPYYAVPRIFDFPETLAFTNNFKLKRAV